MNRSMSIGDKVTITPAQESPALVTLSRWIEWRRILTVVQPNTLIRWHLKGFQVFWRWKSKPQGRARLLADLRHSDSVVVLRRVSRLLPGVVRLVFWVCRLHGVSPR